MRQPVCFLCAPALALTLLTSCTTPAIELAAQPLDERAKTFDVAVGKANIYVVRMGGYASSYRNLPVVIDGSLRGFLSKEQYLRFEVNPGSHTVVTYTSEQEGIVRIDATAGTNYFIGYTTQAGMSDLLIEARELSQAEGKSFVTKSKLAKMLQ